MHALSRTALALSAASVALLLLTSAAAGQQLLPQPRESPRASLTQTIGVTAVTVTWHRPAAKGRAIWGELVPYGEVWRAGANENTTISFSSAVSVEGQELAAGTYGLHMLPTPTTWTVIFSRNSASWGSFGYSQAEDALRVTVMPGEAPTTEWLDYEFSDLGLDAATLSLRWAQLTVPVRLSVDTQQVVLQTARESYLPGLPATFWQGPNSAAAYCLRQGINLEEALTWSDRSIAIAANATNLGVKAGLLEALGRRSEAEPLRRQAMALATENERNAMGYEFLQSNQLDRALEVFKANVAAHPDSWNTHDSLAEACQLKGDTKAAIQHYTRALELVQDAANRARIEGTLKELKAL